jgi:hypothetical protein
MLYRTLCIATFLHLICLGAADPCSIIEIAEPLRQAIEVVLLPRVVDEPLVRQTRATCDPITGVISVTATLIVHADVDEADIFRKHVAGLGTGPGTLIVAPWRQRAYAEIRNSRTEDRRHASISPTLLASITLTHDSSLSWPEYLICMETAKEKTFHYSLHTASGTQPKRDLMSIWCLGGFERFAAHPDPAISKRITEGDPVTEKWWRDFLRVRKAIGIKFNYEVVQRTYEQVSAALLHHE